MKPLSGLTVLVLGGNGMLGHVVVGTLAQNHLRTVATLRGSADEQPALKHFLHGAEIIGGMDAFAPDRLESEIRRLRPDVIVNCIGMIKQKPGSENALETIALNTTLPHRLVEIANSIHARIIQISTDCVFSGKAGNYTEADLPDPPDFYGRSKLLGEIGAPHLTLRTSLIGWQIHGNESLLNWFWQQRGKAIAGYKNAIFSGLTCEAFALILFDVIREFPRLDGVWHVASKPISKFELLKRLNERLGRPVEITADSNLRLDRSLNGQRFAEQTRIETPDWGTMLDEIVVRRKEYDDYGPEALG